MTAAQSPAVPALIFGPHITALGVLRTLAGRGVACWVADETDDIITRSRWYRSPGRTLAETDDSAVLAGYLRSLDLDRAVLFGCSDRWTLAVAGLPADMRERFVASVPERDVIEQLTDKDRFGALVTRLEIPHPFTLEITTPADLDQVSDEQIAHGFLKPTSSQLHRQHFGTKGSFVSSRAAAAKRVEEAAAVGIDFVFQEWIPGNHAASILIDGLVDRNGELPALTARRKVREYPRRLGTTSSSVGIEPGSVASAVDSVKRLVAGIGYRGFFNIEFKFDHRDGEYKIIEFNPRPCWYTGTIAGGGVDLPWLGYLDALGQPVPRAGSYPRGRYAMYEFGDANAIMGAFRNGRRPEGAVLRPWLTADRALFWWKDPMPALGGVWQAARRRATRFASRGRRQPGGSSV